MLHALHNSMGLFINSPFTSVSQKGQLFQLKGTLLLLLKGLKITSVTTLSLEQFSEAALLTCASKNVTPYVVGLVI